MTFETIAPTARNGTYHSRVETAVDFVLDGAMEAFADWYGSTPKHVNCWVAKRRADRSRSSLSQ